MKIGDMVACIEKSYDEESDYFYDLATPGVIETIDSDIGEHKYTIMWFDNSETLRYTTREVEKYRKIYLEIQDGKYEKAILTW